SSRPLHYSLFLHHTLLIYMLPASIQNSPFPYTTLFRSNSPSDAQNMMPLATFDRFFESRILKFYVTQLLSVEGSRSVLANVINRSEEHTSELQSRENLVCRLLLEKNTRLSASHVTMSND